MKIYFAGRYRDAAVFRHMGDGLREMGHQIVSSWIYTNRRAGRNFEDISDEEKATIAQEDVDDVLSCDVLVLLSSDGGRGGKHVEFGIAIGAGKRICVLGQKQNVFHWLLRIEEYNNVIRQEGAKDANPNA